MDQRLQSILNQKAIIVQQEVELSNVMIGIDTGNKYCLHAPGGERLGQSAEISGGVGGFLLRNILNNARSATVKLFGNDGYELGEFRKPLRWIFSEMSATLGGQEVGRAKRTSMVGRNYSISVMGMPTFTISSSLFQWGNFKFDVKRGGIHVARIMKRYEGALKMMFTQADTFTIEFIDDNLSLEERYTLLATTFLIDYDCFEQR
tara:strand:+ start:777 stop:1391 length:615 start_codon:yes stop_codon:yes gene_type:complete